MKNVWFAIKWAILIVIIMFLAVNLWNLFARNVLKQEWPTIFGVSSAVVQSDSMYPTFVTNDYLIYCTASDYQVGDIIAFKSGNSFTTHRIVAINEDGTYTTKGDNPENSIDPTTVAKADVEGKVVLIMQDVGSVITFLHSVWGIVVIAVVGCFLILIDPIVSSCKKKEGEYEENI